MALHPALNLDRMFPPGTSWANVVDAEEAARPAGRSRSRSRSRSAAPSSGNTRTNARGRMMIYTEKPALLASGQRVRGHWFPAVDPEGDYGGPYANLRQLMNNSRWRSDMADLAKDQAAYSEWRAAQRAGPAARARSRSRSTRRNRSRSRGRGRSRSRGRAAGRGRTRSRSRG